MINMDTNISSHANFHMHKATHDNEYVEWEEE